MSSHSRQPAAEGGYDPSFFDKLAHIEDRHFWFVCRNELILELARRANQELNGARSPVLEIGCGTGNVLRHFAAAFHNHLAIGVDLWSEGLRYARRRTQTPLVRCDVTQAPFATQFAAVGIFDVLEHLPDDMAVLRDIYSLLAPGGLLLLTVPAHQSLWSYFDDAALHCRRYEESELREKLTAAGFKSRHVTQFMGCSYPLVWLNRKLFPLFRRKKAQAGAFESSLRELRIIPVLNPIMRALTRIENRWILRGHSPLPGTSLLALAQKPAAKADRG